MSSAVSKSLSEGTLVHNSPSTNQIVVPGPTIYSVAEKSDDALLPVLAAALHQTRSAACITTADLDCPGPTIVYVNPAYCEMTGRSENDVIGRTPRIMQGPLTDRGTLDRLRSNLEAGRPFVGETINYRLDGTPFVISWRIDPVVDTSGETTHYIATQQDVTRLRRAERLLEAERRIDHSVSKLLSDTGHRTDNFGGLIDELQAAVAELVGYGQTVVVGSAMLGATTSAFRSKPNGIHKIVMDRIAGAGGVVTSGTAVDGLWIGCSLEDKRAGVDGALVVKALSGPELDFVDVESLQRASEGVQRAISSLAEYERQRLTAVELQRNLLPADTPVVDGLSLSARYEPGAFLTDVGGDWYDVIETDDNRVVLVVGDLAGSGIRAAAEMGRVRVLTKSLLQQGAAAAEVLPVLNRFCSEEDLVGTALAVTIDQTNGEVTAVSAGHLPPIVRSSSVARLATVPPGPLLGIGGEPVYPVSSIDATAGETLLLFTDGLIERADEPIDESLAGLVSAVETMVGDCVSELCHRLVEDRLKEDPGDDIAVLAALII